MIPLIFLKKLLKTLLFPPLLVLVTIARAVLPTVKVSVETVTPVQLLTGERNPSRETIIAACREIRCSTIKSISKRQANSHLSDYKQQLDKWRLESEKRTEEIYKIGAEDKELMKAVASGLRCLKVLKNKRDVMHSYYNKNISAMINDGTATGEKLMAMKNCIKVVDAAILDKKNACLDLLNYGQLEDLSDSGYTSPVKTDPFQNVEQDLNPPVETMQKVLNLVTEENSMLRGQLSVTVKKLEDILKVSLNINNEVNSLNEKFTKMNAFNNEMSNLQDKLDHERDLLLKVQADRDIMKHKLKTLEALIKEEEEFLGDSRLEFDFEDSDVSSLAADLDLDFSSSSR